MVTPNFMTDPTGHSALAGPRDRRNLCEQMDPIGCTVAYLDIKITDVVDLTMRVPKGPNVDLGRIFDPVTDQGFIIHPGKLTEAGSIQVGSIAHGANRLRRNDEITVKMT